MSDQLIYLLMTGMNSVQDHMTASSNNLANVGTTAFKAQQPAFQAVPFYGQGLPDRADVVTQEEQPNFKQGPIQTTGRSLDVAIDGPGWIGVQAPDGTTAYTRDGSLYIAPSGALETAGGYPVLDQNGNPIVLPALSQITIGADGTISGVPQGQQPDQIIAYAKIDLANPPPGNMKRSPDGLFEDGNGQFSVDSSVTLQVGALEGSNVSSVGVMVDMIKNTRMFQMQTQMLHSVGTMDTGSQDVLSLQ
ncbi:MAG: flagellar basal body rod protein FlgF [Stellaceae bacterium]